MSLRVIFLTTVAAGLLGLAGRPAASQEAKTDAGRKALREVQDFIGVWNLEGTRKVNGRTEAWKEKVSWGWKFKDGDAWITVDFAGGKGKHFRDGTLKYDTVKKKYVLTLTTAEKTEQVFVGDLVRGVFKLEAKDARTGDVHRLSMNTLADGIRFQLKHEKQDGGRGLFSALYAMNGNKDGESIAGAKKKPECIVSGGAATIPVSYQGKTYYVCCTGCRDEFNANPEKYLKAAKK